MQPTTHLSTPKGWKAELAWVAGYAMRQFTGPKAVTHPSTNRALCRATVLIETNALPLHQTANQPTSVVVMDNMDNNIVHDLPDLRKEN